MVAIDTNVLVRLLTNDHPEQSPRARALLEGHQVFVSLTVLLETEWVLRSAYGFASERIYAALRAVAGLPQVQVEAPNRLAQALEHAEAGLDFADALHLSASETTETFATFDMRLIKGAQRLGLTAVREP
ncbi:type II toxin-antitoxin system VapC family toxin [Rubellimicrobium roseum]|uniref:Type II toxin-antitoxin system VapC family toxin n=1 Tax=Rubellimicrobium roseum TaxID=687525 RepID=A0A5C4N6V7_9RHOB|nr:type II toxin-antitoxin system VapC family toxin [Rubellimicrobium roseum]TNC61180.1 type II toxin-antitoxin system VapC family toxin [Rubellimicrobium roseum]